MLNTFSYDCLPFVGLFFPLGWIYIFMYALSLDYMCGTSRFVTYVYTCHGGLLHPSTCHLHYVFLLILSLPYFLTPDRSWCVMFPSLCPRVLIVQLPHMSENMQRLIFCSCVSLLGMMVSRFIHVPTKDMNSSFLMAA